MKYASSVDLFGNLLWIRLLNEKLRQQFNYTVQHSFLGIHVLVVRGAPTKLFFLIPIQIAYLFLYYSILDKKVIGNR